MDVAHKLRILADAARYDATCAASGVAGEQQRPSRNPREVGIYRSQRADGRAFALLKVLLTNECTYGCKFCVNRATNDVPRATLTPEEVIGLTVDYWKAGAIDGLFLSSGVWPSPDGVMERMIAVARGLRLVHNYDGYIHLKAVPGAAPELLAEAGKWCDRLSANIELPTQADLDQLAPQKQRNEIEAAMGHIRGFIQLAKMQRRKRRNPPDPTPKAWGRRAGEFAPAGQTTQMIVGATPTNDAGILRTASELYRRHWLNRVYYSAYQPIGRADSLPQIAPHPVRQLRLYQADALLRFYRFRADEIAPPDAPNLDPRIDPKLAWALRNRGYFPVDVNSAPREALLRVPGLGPASATRIIHLRRIYRFRMKDLAALRIVMRKAQPFLVAADYDAEVFDLDRADFVQKLRARCEQLELFPSETAS